MLDFTRDDVELSTRPLCSKEMFDRKLSNYEAVERSFGKRSEICLGFPVELSLEPSGDCNLYCPGCPRGRGRIKRVDVSFDGGVNWRPARLKGLVLPKALTRFSYEWNWDGSPGLLQSRAIDETGYVQPTLKQLRDVRGLESIYHKNAIHTWRLASNGQVTNVQID